MRYAIVALAVTAVLVAPTGAFYLPGVAPQDYARVRVWQFFNFFSPFSPLHISPAPNLPPSPPLVCGFFQPTLARVTCIRAVLTGDDRASR